jgi:hypothetical protein
MVIMIIKKEILNEVIKILESFDYVPKKSITEKNKIIIPKYLLSYIENRLNNKNVKIASYKTKFANFYVEFINHKFYLTRDLLDGKENKVVLQNDDLKLIKNVEKITKKEMKELVNKVEYEEKRFGL